VNLTAPTEEARTAREDGKTEGHKPPSQSSKMVLVSVHGGGPILTIHRTVFALWLEDL